VPAQQVGRPRCPLRLQLLLRSCPVYSTHTNDCMCEDGPPCKVRTNPRHVPGKAR
jgi:hypothetical protein